MANNHFKENQIERINGYESQFPSPKTFLIEVTRKKNVFTMHRFKIDQFWPGDFEKVCNIWTTVEKIFESNHDQDNVKQKGTEFH